MTIAGQLYKAAPIRRDNGKAVTQDDEQIVLEIEMPFNLDLIHDYAFTSSPPNLDIEIWRIHWGMNFSTEAVKIFSGPVQSFSIDGVHVKLRSTTVFAACLSSPVPLRWWQKLCNHVLYDARCGLASSSYTHTTTVGIIDGADISVSSTGFADGYLAAGEMVTARSGERRMIVANAANLVTVNFPFNDLVAGDTVYLFAGCDHSFSTCKAKFSNVANFSGCPYIPDTNPFSGSL